MKISLKWLNEYIDIKDFLSQPEKLGSLLTNAGLEVESINNLAKGLDHVVIGQIVEKSQHPNADRLTLCLVRTGESQTQPIVCGAKNHNAGDYVVVALPGAVLPGDFAIKKSKIRGVESEGMLCSEKELGLSAESEGIMILQGPPPAVGTPFSSYWGLDDVVIEIKVTPNRADCLSHVGLAREISALLNRPIKPPEVSFSEGKRSTRDMLKIELKESEWCPRYTGKVITGVKVAPSPAWLKGRLETVGLKSINNIVDVTNYVMLELGQPLHAFDLKSLRGARISIARSSPGERFETLDGTDLELSGEELMIQDAEGSIALGGVMGGKNSGISDETTDVFVESAYFLSSSVRRTSRRFGMETDSAYRFARGIDPEGLLFALKRACHLIQKLAGGEPLKENFDLYPQPLLGKLITVSVKSVEERLGYSVLESDFKQWMVRLGCQFEGLATKDGILKVRPPAYRQDLNIEADLIEEYARLNGYDKIPETLPVLAHAPQDDQFEYRRERLVAEQMSELGFKQAVHYGFLSDNVQKHFLGTGEKAKTLNLWHHQSAVKLLNPLSADLDSMRISLVPALIQTADHNFKRGNIAGALFELGYVFNKAQGDENNSYQQSLSLGLIQWGKLLDWTRKDQPLNPAHAVRAAVDQLLKAFRIKNYRWENLRDKAPDLIHPAQCAGLFCEGKWIGYIGSLHPKHLSDLKINEEVTVGELNLELLFKALDRPYKLSSISKTPSVTRDLAFVVQKSIAAGDIASEIGRIAGEELAGIEVFDVYTGQGVPEDSRSIGFRLRLQKLDQTFSEDELHQLQDKIVKGIRDKFAVNVR